MPGQTPSQTVGPFFAYGLTPEPYGRRGLATGAMAVLAVEGEHIHVTGRVLDGAGAPVPDAMVEIWQANAHGRYNHPADPRKGNRLDPSFRGFGRVSTDGAGGFLFHTVKPGPVPGPEGREQAPHLNVVVFARGMLSHAYTRFYFADEREANAADPVLERVPAARRATLLAEPEDGPGGRVYHIDIRLQGEQETVFFDV